MKLTNRADTYKLLFVEPANVEVKTLTSAIKGLPISIVFVRNQRDAIKMMDTDIQVPRQGFLSRLFRKII